MAHVGIVSAAYWGDVMPFVPVADELVRRGHRVSFVVPRGFHDPLDGHAFELVHLGTDFSPRELADHGEVLDGSNTMRGMRAAAELWIRHMLLDRIDDVLAVLADVSPDLWIAHNSVFWLVELQAAPEGVPVVAGHLFPMMVPSVHQHPPIPLPIGDRPALNRLGWRLGRAMTGRMMYDDTINELRAARGLAPHRSHVAFGWQRARLVLLLTSATYWPPPPDWPDHIQMTGFTVWGAPHDPLPPDMTDHLRNGDPPVCITLGTSAAADARNTFALIAEAVCGGGRRAVLLVGNHRNRRALAARNDVWTFAPLPAVLSHCSAVVHAGGHGTTAAALHAGIPQVVMPRGFDQLDHARRLEQLGVGVQIPCRHRNTQRIAAALVVAHRADTRSRATHLAEHLAPEQGPSNATNAIEHVLTSSERPT